MTLQTEKTKKLMNLLDTLDFNQIVIFVKTSCLLYTSDAADEL